MTIASWPKAEQPREKLRSRGAAALSDAELLAIFLRTGTNGRTAVDIARELLVDFEGLRPLIDTDEKQFCNKKGLGPTKYVQIQAAIELGRRYLEAGLIKNSVLSRPQDTRDYLRAKLCAYPYEVFACLFLDNRHRIISFDELFRGTIDGASVYPREVVKQALAHNAAAASASKNSRCTGLPDKACIVSGVINSQAVLVITTRTSAPCSCNRRTSSALL